MRISEVSVLVSSLAMLAACAPAHRAEPTPVVSSRPFTPEDSAAAVAAGYEVGPTANVVTSDPCLDPRYVELRTKELEDMTEREYEYFRQRDASCVEYRRQQELTGQQAAAANRAANSIDRATSVYTFAVVFSLLLGAVTLFALSP